ncbi:TPA: glycosyltransferase [Candidatus Poribacteria bacterium]|nr:glycosyltransferase [Candidatus Poribacteria bacterium]
MLYFIIFTFTLGFIYALVVTIFFIGLLRLRNEDVNPTLGKSKSGGIYLGAEQSDLFSQGCLNHSLPSVSVVVAARNEADNLPACLKSLLTQSYPSEQYEVVVIDDHSTDNTYSIARAFAVDNPILKVLRLDDTAECGIKRISLNSEIRIPMGKQMALDWGIQACRGEIILSTDADCIVPKTWIESMVKAYERKIGVVVGFSMLNEGCQETRLRAKRKVGEPSIDSSLTKFHRFLRSLFIKLQSLELLSLFSAFAGGLKMGVALACTGNNLAYRRQVYDELGGFVNLGITVAEDNMFLQWVDRYSKWHIKPICHTDVTVLTHPMRTVRDFMRQRLRWASNSTENRLSLVCFMVIAYGFYLLLPTALLLAVFGALLWKFTLVFLSLKLIPEFLLVLRGLKLFNRMDLLKYFPLLEPCQILYVLICGIFGLLFNVIWKGRQFSS